MSSNPNPDLFFDMPDMTPQFEFDLSPPKKKNASVNPTNGEGRRAAIVARRAGFGRKKFGLGRGGGGGGGGGDVAVVAARARPSASSSSSTPDRSCDHSKDGYTTATTASASVNSTSMESGKCDSPLRLPSPLSYSQRQRQQSHGGNGQPVALVSSASMDMSEFSFDRVTVTTNETGFLSNDDDGGGGGGGAGWGCRVPSPPTIPPVPVAAAAAHDNAPPTFSFVSSLRVRRNGGRSSFSTTSTSSFLEGRGGDDALMLPDQEVEAMAASSDVCRAPASTYNVGSSSQSVISEISERTGAFSLGSCVIPPPALQADDAPLPGKTTTDGGYDTDHDCRPSSSSNYHHGGGGGGGGGGGLNSRTASRSLPSASSVRTPSRKSSTSKTPNNNNDSNNNARTTSLPSARSLFEDVRLNYVAFRASREGDRKKKSAAAARVDDQDNDKLGASVILRRIVEDFEFCGWYLCGIDTTAVQDEDVHDRAMAREARKKEAENTFLGREIRVSACSPFCASM